MKKQNRKAAKTWTHKQLSRNVFEINTTAKTNKDWEFWLLVTADQHWDNPKSNREMQLEHLQLARKRGAAVMSAGDYFCLMQGKYDKRSNKAAIRPEHNKDNYIDAVIDDAANWLAPYADLYTVIACGNHENAIDKRYEINVLDRFSQAIYSKSKQSVYNGGYSGYIILKFKESNGGTTHSIILRYEHGAGGSSPVTGGVIDAHRRGLYFPDADIMVSGHNHNSWMVEYARQRIDARFGRLQNDIQTHIKTPSYKDGFGDGFSSWEATVGMPPKPAGAYWIRFYFKHGNRSETSGLKYGDKQVRYEVIKAS